MKGNLRDTLKAMKAKTHDLTYKGDGVSYYDPTTIFIPLLKHNFSNITHYENQKLEEIILKARTTTSLKERESYLQQAEQVIREERGLVTADKLNSYTTPMGSRVRDVLCNYFKEYLG